MLRVENQAKRDASSGLSLALACHGLTVEQYKLLTKTELTCPWLSAGTSRAPVNEWDA
jgi:hypothetical protein